MYVDHFALVGAVKCFVSTSKVSLQLLRNEWCFKVVLANMIIFVWTLCLTNPKMFRQTSILV